MSAAPARVWAPYAQHVELCLPDRRIPLVRNANDWWSSTESVLEHGTPYAYALDGGTPRPDPRSRWQPDGPHGWSAWIDQGAFEWHDSAFQPPAWDTAIVYELHVGTFSPEGTFEGAIGRLDALVELGVSHVELMPVAEFPGRWGWGYDGVDLFAPESAYGGPAGLKQLVAAAHERGLAMLLDVVYNHFGPDGNYLPEFGPYLTDRYRTPWGDAVNLDGSGSDEVRRFLVDNAIQWLRDYHFDGLRVDAVHALIDMSAVHFLEQLSTEVDALQQELGRPLVLVAESDLGDPRVVRSRAQHGYGIDAQWNDEFRHALHVVLSGEQNGIHGDFHGIADLATAIRDVFVYQGQRSSYRHRHQGRPVQRDLPRWKFVSFLQDHDQVGNRALGERSAALLSEDALRIAAALVLLGPNVPLLFAGEEWAASTPFLFFADHREPRLAEAVRAGRRAEFAGMGWPEEAIPDPEDERTFDRSRLNWDEREDDVHGRVLGWYGQLCGLRWRVPGLRAGSWPIVACDASGWLTVERNETLLAANLGSEPAAVDATPTVDWRIELASCDEVTLDAQLRLALPPMSMALLLPR